MQNLLQDFRYALRTLRKTPGVTFAAVLALTLGIGLTTGAFSIVYGVLMRGLPYPGADRVAVVYRNKPSQGLSRQALPIQAFVDYKARQRSFTELGAYTSGTMNVSGTERAERYAGGWITANVFRIIGVQPALGRAFHEGEDAPGGDRVAMLSDEMWRDRFNRDPAILGKVIRVNGLPFSVVGVMPAGFAFPDDEKLWLPLQTNPLASKRGEGQSLIVIGKRKAGVTMDAAAADMGAIATQLAAQYPQTDGGFTATVGNFVDWSIGPGPRRLLYTMLGAVFGVLLIACANVTNLLLDRAAHRTKEIGIRTALGASRAAVMRQFLAEAFVLSLAGLVLGIGVAHFGISAFARAIEDKGTPSFIQLGLFAPVLAFAAAVGILATLASGAIPAYQSARSDINVVLKDESRGASSLHIGRVSNMLVMFEIALSCALLVPAGLMIKSVAQLRAMDPGFTTRNVFTARVGFPDAYTDTLKQERFFAQLQQRVAAIQGVQAAALSSGLPGAQQGLGGTQFALEGTAYAKDGDYPNTSSAAVTPQFFTALGINVQHGRLFTDADRQGALPVAVVSHRFVERYLKGASPIGQRLRFGASNSTAPWLTIVGVTPDIFGGDPDDPRPPIVFQPLAQAYTNFVYISARTAGAPMSITSSVRDIVSSLEPDVPIYWPMRLDEAIDAPLWFVRVFGVMFTIFGAVALILGAVGLYAVMSFSVSRRTREVGIRMALGARGRTVAGMILGKGLVQLAIGVSLGLLLATGISNLLGAVLFDVKPRDPFVFGAVAAALVTTGILACVVPAMRAVHVDPLVALRNE